MLKKFFALLLGLLMTSFAFATSVSVLYGDNFRDDLGYRKDKTTLTIENFSVWEYGTVFFYFDLTEPTTNDNSTNRAADEGAYSNQYFGGISPTFSLTKMTGKEWSWKFIRDVQIRLELENGSGNGDQNFRNYFYGLQYDLAVPGFDFVSLNTVIRDNPESRGVGFQIGGFWQMSHEFAGRNRFKFTGFFATSPWDGDIDPEAEGPKETYGASKRGRYLTTQPQFLYDLGYALWGKKDRAEIGVEYAYFINRFQLKERDEKVMQAMIKLSY